jgi:pantothenate kinase
MSVARSFTVADLVDRARGLIQPGRRRMLGITGSPGSGKSTLSALLVDALGDEAVLVPMDGFHLANAELERLGRRDRKGAIDTFDSAGFVSLLRRLRNPAEQCVYAPVFWRKIEEPIANAIPVRADIPLVVTEGNYLLQDAAGWGAVRGLLDEVWFLDLPDDTRLERLIRRHEAYGKSPEQARAWSRGTDQRNAELIEATRHRADLVVHVLP